MRNENNAGNVRAHQPTRSATTTPTIMTFRPFTAHLPGLQRETRAAVLRAQRDAALRLDRAT
ncbi:hypothetical protein [Xanthomonas bonasiae]|uniref:hypothetical protein n=1 Tax=Xanthomonas bonasiae TaxID=2810351 RepID=UPI0017863055|nr:hypothetical protein [Xanthomonas surreyensis]MBD7923267.1 hypothetical protein [Xanthomonas surreyensis]